MEIRLPFGLRMARKGFTRSRFKRKPVGCAYVKGSKIIIAGNDLKTSPLSVRLGSRKGRIHAEVAVLRNLSSLDAGGKLFVYREKKDGSLGLARPCHSCLKLIAEIGIKIVFYSTEKGFAKEKLL